MLIKSFRSTTLSHPFASRGRTSRSKLSGSLLLLPFFLFVIGRTYNFGDNINELAQGDPALKTAILAVAYFLAVVLIITRLNSVSHVGNHLWPYLLYAGYALITALWSDFPQTVALRCGHMLGLMFVALCTSLWVGKSARSFILLLCIAMIIALSASVLYVWRWPESAVIKPEWGGDEFGAGQRWVGITNHPNILGSIAFCGFWAGLTGFILKPSIKWRSLSVVLILLAIVSLKGSDSRTATLSCGIAAFVILSRLTQIGRAAFQSRKIRLLGFVLIITICLAFYINGHFGFSEFSTREGASDALSDRPVIWAAGLDSVLSSPYGLSFDLLQGYWRKNGGEELYPHFHNGFLDVAVKGGIVSEVLLISILWSIWRSFVFSERSDEKIAGCMQAFFLAFFAYNFIDTGYDRESLLWGVLIICWICVLRANVSSGIRNRRRVSGGFRGTVAPV